MGITSLFSSETPPPLAGSVGRALVPGLSPLRERWTEIVSGDSAEARLQKRLQLAMAIASIPAISTWGVSFVAIGHPAESLWCFGYVGLTALMVLVLFVTRRWELFRVPHPILVMLAPFGLHWQLGGFLGSGGAILWCLLAPVAAMMFTGARRSVPMFLLMVGLALLGWWREAALPPPSAPLTAAQMSASFALNLIGVVAFLYFSTRYFVSRIDAEKARSERLLLNVLPRPIAERLKVNAGVIADRYESVTVLFCDIVGFTPLAARLGPEEIVRVLDEIFMAFDAIADRFGLEKIKTIGDAYMVVAGVPAPCADHAARMARGALAMRDFVGEFARKRDLALAMRIGIHSGPVVAGVIGRRKFTYDLWGDTVNTASRMESHGEADRIHVTAATKALLERDSAFIVTERGPISVKGKGDMTTYWLDA